MSKDLVRRAVGFMKLGQPKPIWFDTVAHQHPPLTFKAANAKLDAKGTGRRPPKIIYPEDGWVQKFYQQHPEERMRPTSALQGDGPNDEDGMLAVDQLVLRQMELMEADPRLEAAQAYEEAYQWFWEERARQEIAKKVAREEYLHTKEQMAKTDPVLLTSQSNRKSEAISGTLRVALEEEKAVLSREFSAKK